MNPTDADVPMTDNDLSDKLAEQVHRAVDAGTSLCIRGGGTKDFYGRHVAGDCERLDVYGHTGIITYEPTELALTVRAGTRLAAVEQLLADSGQRLPFEPPAFGETATIGGVVAAGLSGPRRPYGGAVRDAVLGVKIINGRGEILEFGGRVMKNVAGYDVSRLMAGSLGTLGVLLEVSLKVLPRAALEKTVMHKVSAVDSVESLMEWSRHALAITAACHDGENLYVRVCGGERSLQATLDIIGGEPLAESRDFWRSVREQTHPFFRGDEPLWRVSVPPASPPLDLGVPTFKDWGGALRWVRGDLPAAEIRDRAQSMGGHATLFRGHDGTGEVFHPLPPALFTLHRNVKRALDPSGIFNPGRMYAEL